MLLKLRDGVDLLIPELIVLIEVYHVEVFRV